MAKRAAKVVHSVLGTARSLVVKRADKLDVPALNFIIYGPDGARLSDINVSESAFIEALLQVPDDNQIR